MEFENGYKYLDRIKTDLSPQWVIVFLNIDRVPKH